MISPSYGELWIGCMNEPNAVFRWIECHPGVASFVQALGVIATVAAALFAPRLAFLFDKRERIKARRRLTEEVVSVLKPAAQDLAAQLREKHGVLHLYRGASPPADRWTAWFNDELPCSIPVPIEFLHQFPGTDPAAIKYFVQVRDAIMAYNTECRIQKNGHLFNSKMDRFGHIWIKIDTARLRALSACENALALNYHA